MPPGPQGSPTARMDLTTKERVKVHLGGFSGSGEDAYIDLLIDEVSQAFEAYMRRKTLETTYTETLWHPKFSNVVSMQTAPVSAVSSVKYASHPDNLATTTAMASTTYSLDSNGGFIRFLASMNYDPGFLEVAYTGGMGTDTSDFITNYPQVAQAADWQVGFEFSRRKNPGGNTVYQGGSTAFTGDLDLLANVKRTLDTYRRGHV